MTIPALPARKRRSPGERHDEIVRAAITLFARQGFERTTTKEIAAEAGISEGTIYKYFTSKQEILFAFIAPTAFSSVPGFFQDYEGCSDKDILVAFLRDRLALLDANRDLLRVIFGEALFSPALAVGLHRSLAPAIDAVVGYLEQRKTAGAFRQMDAGIAARMLFGSVLFNFIVWDLLAPEDADRPSPDALSRTLAGIFLDGITASATMPDTVETT